MATNSIYATPREVRDLDLCHFYHTMDIPEYGIVEGEWNFLGREAEYLGGVCFEGKRVLEVGTASGGLCFYMESFGAEVVCFDLSEEQDWDIVPFSRSNLQDRIQGSHDHIKRLNNSYWLSHRAFRSRARVVYGSAYNIPREVGAFDVVVLGCVLLHVRDPFLVLQNALQFAAHCAVVTESYRPSRWQSLLDRVGLSKTTTRPGNRSRQEFLPDFRMAESPELWWYLPPETIVNYMGILGFEDVEVHFHTQKHENKDSRLYTAVGKRTSESTFVGGL